jgi:23S rRNA G2445 N2-methylase RlmL
VLYELDVLPGLKALALDEWRATFESDARLLSDGDPEAIRFEWSGPAERMLRLRLATAANLLLHFEIRRPRELLGHRDFTRLAIALREVASRQAFTGVRVNAAGSGSSVFQRLKSDLGAAVRLPVDDAGGDLLLRVRPSAIRDSGWDVLIRLTPRPLATRAWRMANMPAAMNATVAAAMVRLSRPKPDDRVLNLMCGSGTLLAERAAAGPSSLLVGSDHSSEALALAAANLDRPVLVRADAVRLPFMAGSFGVVLTDLPWGGLSGSHAANLELYPKALAEAARVAAPDARAVLLSHEIKLLDRALAGQVEWRQVSELSVFQGGLRPRMKLLSRTADSST